jgi:hypothetical protein
MEDLPLGQMSEEERKYIKDLIINSNIKLVLESGTWYGGGSTLSIMKGLSKTGGILYTYEEFLGFYKVAKNFYEKSIYRDQINLFNCNFVEGIKNLDSSFLNQVDLILLDGGDENPTGGHKLPINQYLEDYNVSENVQSFKFIQDKIKIGCNLLLHDWTTEIGRGFFVKKYLEDTMCDDFKLINLLETTTGLAHLIKVK